jgi:peptide/nickel transport system permease protein
MAEIAEPKRHSLLVNLVIRLVKEKPLGTVGGVIFLAMFFTGIFADFIAPYGYNVIDTSIKLSGPMPGYLLGTDQLGRDLLSRVIYGARISMVVGLGGAAIGTILAAVLGGLSGYLGGKFDIIMQRFVDALMAWPWLLFVLTLMVIVGRGIPQVILVLGLRRGVIDSRIVRSAVIGVKENMYVEAARAIGAPTGRILTRHILPNVFAAIIIIFSLDVGNMILQEAVVSFLGFGIPPPLPSWGGMLSSEGRRFMIYAPWLAVWPGLALSTAVYGINMLGDAIRDILDPRLRGGRGRYGATVKKEATKIK